MVARRAHAEEHVTAPVGEIRSTAGARQDRHHAGDPAAARDAQYVLVHVGMERRAAERREQSEPRAFDAGAEQPLADAAAGLLLHDERQPLRTAVEVDHGVRARAGDIGHGDERELAVANSSGASISMSNATT